MTSKRPILEFQNDFQIQLIKNYRKDHLVGFDTVHRVHKIELQQIYRCISSINHMKLAFHNSTQANNRPLGRLFYYFILIF